MKSLNYKWVIKFMDDFVKLIQILKLKGFSKKTIRSYIYYIVNFQSLLMSVNQSHCEVTGIFRP